MAAHDDPGYLPTKDEVAAFYDAGMAAFEQIDANIHSGYWESGQETLHEASDAMTDLVIEHLSPVPGGRYLDIGCGLGEPAMRLARQQDVEVLGIADSRELVARATTRAKTENVSGVQFEIMDAEHLAFPPESFDGVFAIESLVHIPNRRQVIESVATVLKPGGRFVITDRAETSIVSPRQKELIETYRRLARQAPSVRIDMYLRWLIDAGFTINLFRDITPHTAPHQLAMIEHLRSAGSALSDATVLTSLEKSAATIAACHEYGVPRNILLSAERSSSLR